MSITAGLRRLLRRRAPLDIVYVAESLDISGGVRVIVDHANGLACLGHRVRIVTRDARHGWLDVRVPILEVPRFDAETLPPADVHIATWFATVTPTVEAARAKRIYHFSQGFEGTLPYVADRRLEIEKAYLQPIPKLLVSRHLLDLFRGRFPGPFHVLPQTVDVDFFRPEHARTEPGSPIAVGIVGPFESPTKGIREALEAVSRLRSSGLPIVLRRASPLPLSEPEAALCLSDSYAFRATTTEMRAWYRSIDILVHPPFEAEGFPLPPLEAMASGVPVILTRIRSFEPLAENEAIRVPPGDVDAIRMALQELIGQPAVWKSLREAGLRAAERFRPERARDALENVLQGRSAPD